MSLSVDLEKRLGSFHLRVQFQAEDEITALLGASGCGKSMTLKCIAGIVTPDRGRIVLNDRVLFDSEAGIDLPPQQRRVGYLFQNYALFPNMTVEKNILCGIRSGSKVEKAAALAEALHRFRLTAAAGGTGPHPLHPAGGHFAGRTVFRPGQLSEMEVGVGAFRPAGGFSRPDPVGVPRPGRGVSELQKGLRHGAGAVSGDVFPAAAVP